MNNINTSLKKIYSLLILTFLFFLILINTTLSEEKIGSIVSLKNEVFAINVDGEKRLLDLYDAISLQDEIVTNELSTATVQYNDNSTIIIKKSSSFKVTDFNITGLKGVFLGKVQKGSVIIESGKIAKEDNGSMVIELPKMTLGIKGTRFNIENNPDGTSAVSLAEDSFGNVGTINISSEGKVKTLFDTEQVVSTNTETGFSERVKTDDEKKELVDASNDLIEASAIDENVIQKILEEKLLNGSLLDANGDGIIDTLDVEVIKEGIKLEKQGKIDFIVDNSTGENTEFLSQVLNKSDEASIGGSINKIFDINNDLVASVITNLSNQDNTFLTTSNSEANNAIKEKIYTQMLSDTANVETIGKIISKSDGATIEKMINIVSLSDTNDPNANLSLQVLSSVADANAARAATDPAGLNITFLNTGGQSQVNKLIESAVANAGNNPESFKMLANVITKSDAATVGTMLNNIATVSAKDPNSTLAAQVLSSVATTAATNNTYIDTEKMNQFNDLVNTVAFTNTTTTAEDDAAVALALATVTATLAEDDAAAAALITATTIEEEDATFLYDASGFAFAPPYYHKDTGSMYNEDGLDRNGNSQVVAADLYDASGFAFAPPYYHKDTGSMYNENGLDRNGNSQVVAATNPTWTTQPTFAETYTTSQNISTTATATSSPTTNGITYSATGLPTGVDISPTTGAISGSPTAVGNYSVIVTAKDNIDNTKSITTGSFNIEVTSASSGPTWDTITGPSTLTEGTSISSFTLSATGTGNITYSDDGDLPPGITRSGATVSGTPSTVNADQTSVTFTATDSQGSTIKTFNFPLVSAAAGNNPTWNTAPSDQAFTQNENKSVTFTATADPYTNDIEYTVTGSAITGGLSIGSTTGNFGGQITSTPGSYSATIVARDTTSNKTISKTITITVAAGGSYDGNGFSTTYPFNHQNGTAFNSAGRDYQGYNSAGYNSAGFDSSTPANYNSAYDENISPA